MRYIDMAAKIAKATLNQNKNFCFGGIAIRDDGAVVTGTNLLTKNPMPPAHCEARLLRKAGQNAILYVVRLTKDGKWANAKPCPRCRALIRNKKVKKVYYTVSPETFSVWYP